MTRMGVILLRARTYAVVTRLLIVSLLIGVGLFVVPKASAAQITNRTIQLTTSSAGAHGVTYTISFTPGTPGTYGSIEMQFCDNSSLIEDPCSAPYGLDVLNATIASQSGTVGYYKSPATTVNDLILTQAPPYPMGPGPVSFTFDNVVNPTNEGSYYIKIFTYLTNDASGSPTDFGAMAFPINHAVNVNAEVPPYLTFCGGISITDFDCSTANDSVIDFGQFTSAATSDGQSQLVAATNAGSGYAIYANGTTMTSGNNTLPAMQNEASKVGTSQFGINLRANTVPKIGQDIEGPGTGTVTANYNQSNKFRFNAGETVATATQAQDYRKYTVSYVINVSKDQAPGVYSTTLTYVCLANF